MTVDAIVLAGSGRNESQTRIAYKPMMPIKDRPMILYVLDALCACDKIENIVVVGSPATLEPVIRNSRIRILPEAGTMIDNVHVGMSVVKKDRYVLLVSSDIPMLTVESVDDFISRSIETGADCVYPIVERSICEQRYPGMHRTYVHLKDGSYTGGNLFFLSPAGYEKGMDLARKLVENRKKPLKLAAVLGTSVVLRLLAGRLTVAQAERRAEQLSGLKLKAYCTPYPEIGSDVDSYEHVPFAERHIKEA